MSTASRDARLIAVATLGSRVTGLARVVVAGAVLGTGQLGGLYETANRVPNLLFELFAGGALQAVLVPAFIRERRDRGDAAVRDLSGAVAGTVTALLGMVTLAFMLASPLVIRALTAAEPDATVRADKAALGTAFMLVFVPQVLCYGLAVVASAALAARHRFVAASLAPAVNNVVAIAAYGVYTRMRGGRPPSLHLSPSEFAVLAGGTTLAVVAFAAVPVWLAVRAGAMGPPRVDRAAAAAAGLGRASGWAVVQVAATLVLTLTAVVFGNATANGVGVFLWAQTFMLLPVALVAAPVATACGPRLVAARASRDADAGRRQSEGAMTATVVGLVGAGALLVGLAWPVARLVAFGEAARDGYAPLAHALAWFGAGLPAAGSAFLLSRMLFSVDDARGAALTTVVMAGAGVAAMAGAAVVVTRPERAAALAAGFGAAHVVGTVAMLVRFRNVVPGWLSVGRWAATAGPAVGAGALVAAGAAWTADSFPASRGGALAAVCLVGAAGAVTYLGVVRLVSRRPWGALLHWDRAVG